MRSGVSLVVERMGYEAVSAASGEEALGYLRQRPFDLVITDYRMDSMDGLGVLAAVREEDEDALVMIITAYGTIEIAVEAMKRGAIDFITKPFPPEALQLKVEKALEFRATRLERERLDEENRYLREEIGDRFGEIIGSSDQMRAIMASVEKVAPTDSSVLIYGESGTGKELVARALHNKSHRHAGPFVKVNCGGLPRELVESELFGHEKGSFTGAVRLKKGKFEMAQGGTIFLDEVGEIPLESQVKLLRVLQEKEFDRVGGEQTLTAEVRVVAATNRSLKQMVEENKFRQDLYYRLEVIPLELPPLRARKGDIAELVEHLVDKKCRELNLPRKGVTAEALEALSNYMWPGNVRELENVIERTIVLADGEEISTHDLPLFEQGTKPEITTNLDEGQDGSDISLNRILEQTEKEYIVQAMDRAKGVKTQAADILGIKTSALYYKLDKYELE